MSRNSLGRISKNPGVVSVRVGGVETSGRVVTFDMSECSVLMYVLITVCGSWLQSELGSRVVVASCIAHAAACLVLNEARSEEGEAGERKRALLEAVCKLSQL